MGKNKSSQLIEELLKTIDEVGLEKTISTLQITRQSTDTDEVLQEFIIVSACKEFGIKKQELLTGTSYTAQRKHALGVTALLLKANCNISQTQIGLLIRKDNSNISKYIKTYSNLDVKFKSDRDVIIKIEKLSALIKQFITKIINNG